MISKYAQKIKIKKDIYAIFNSLVMLPIYVNKKQYKDCLYNCCVGGEVNGCGSQQHNK